MRIGPYTLKNNLLLAPMAGITDLPYRRLCREHGAGLAVSEMITSNSALWASPKSVRRMDFAGEPGPISVQIVGSDPESMAQAARTNMDLGADIIDINMGCPAKKVCRVAAGAALLQDEERVKRILHAVVSAVDAPVTLKIRTGWDQHNRNGVRIARIAEESGVQALTVHGRTRACGFSGSAEYHTIREIKQAISIPVIANGDINTPEIAKKVLAKTGVDGIMIGRAARGRPWLFREMQHYLDCGEILPNPSSEWMSSLILKHLQELYDFYGETQGVRIARKHLAWYSRGLVGAAEFRTEINKTGTTQEQQALVKGYYYKLTADKELAA
ncbi:MAG: tRNA dihydrouridine synthase DusB [Gammaproteobacteria bacterium]|nr:tRNA dihydrouridine synthase DusB [Gammaproteobacteria bacterium]